MPEELPSTVELDINAVMRMIPHRYPFLMIDKVVDLIAGESAVGVKCVSGAEPHFQGHFPGKPIMPGVLIIEAMAQTSAVLVAHTVGQEAEDKLVYFMAIDSARFRKPVVPGDTLLIQVNKKQNRGTVWKFEGQASVEGELVAEANFTAMVVDRE